MGKIYEALEKSGSMSLKPESPDQPITEKKNKSKIKTPEKALHSPETPVTIHPDLIVGVKPHSNEAEQFRNLKNNILFPEKGISPRSIMVTSTAPHEGKTFVAANLAISIAQSIDEYVLLMDCDLRDPSIEKLFGFSDTNGLSEYLSKSVPLNNLILNSYFKKLKIVSAGHPPPNPSELLSSDQMRRLLAEVTQRYQDRYVILDTPPPYVTSETSALARQVDGIVLVVRQRQSLKQDLQDVIDIYGREKILGVVYNDAQKLLSRGYGKYGYGYGYGTNR